MNRLHVQRVAEHELDLLFQAQVGKPVPSEHAFGADDQVLTEALNGAQKVVRLGPHEQRVGGYHSFDKDKNDSPATIVLKPLIRVTGKIKCTEASKVPGWTMAIIHPPGDFGNHKHFTQCGSTSGKFSFLLPPGDYDLQVYGDDPDARMPKPHERDDAPKDMPPYLS